MEQALEKNALKVFWDVVSEQPLMPGVPLYSLYKPSSKNALCKLGLFTDNIIHFESPSFICFNQPS